MPLYLPDPVSGLLPLRIVDAPPPAKSKAATGGPSLSDRATDGSAGPMKLVLAVASLGGAPDSDGDISVPGCFGRQDVLLSTWQHGSWDSGLFPIGRGVVNEEANRLVFRGEVWDTSAGRDAFTALKKGADLVEVSYGYTVLDFELGYFEGQRVRFLKKVLVHEVSGVMRGAGRSTGVLETSGLSATNLMLAAAIRDNDRALAGLSRRPSKQVVAIAPDGRPIRLVSGMWGRKVAA